MKVVLYHLFPDLLNLYGDYGNIVSLKFHLESLGIDVDYKKILDISDFDKNECSFILIGGGSDREQAIVTKKLREIKDELKELIENNVPLLAICGGYQFLGKHYQSLDGTLIEGLKIFDYVSKATKNRMVGNIIISTDEGEIVGFENHSGETIHSSRTLGKVIKGYGNTSEGDYEGFKYKNVVGTYMHGPILPKNSPLLKWFISKILKYENIEISLEKLNFEMEDYTRKVVINKLKNNQN
ncbi:MAG: type 1 glutamine amidotransferase [Bacilli bacterium]